MSAGRSLTQGFFRGGDWSRVDKAGRVVIPAAFRRRFEDYGPAVFVTRSFVDPYPHVVVYPLGSWQKIEEEIYHNEELSAMDKMVMMHRLNQHGLETNIDDRGRIMVPQALREYAGITDKVRVIGCFDAVQCWNPEVYKAFNEGTKTEKEISNYLPY